MKKLMCLIKAIMKNNMQLFSLKTKKKTSKITQFLFPLMVGGVIALYSYVYADMLGDTLKDTGYLPLMLGLFVIIIVIMTFISCLYKSAEILFNAKDNDMLMSMPVTKSQILISRFVKLLSFEYIFDILFFVPVVIKYAMLANPGTWFYILSVIVLILLPIIPLTIACLIGTIIKMLSSFSKWKNVTYMVLSLSLFAGIMYFSMNMQGIMTSLASNASSINDMILKVYYPAGLYMNLVNGFDILEFVKLLAISIIPFILVIAIISKFYNKITTKSEEFGTNKNYKYNKDDVSNRKEKTQVSALTSKELKKYFSTPVYMLNTGIGLILMFIITIALIVNFDGLVGVIANNGNTPHPEITADVVKPFMNMIYLELIILTSLMTSITSSSITLERSKIELLKSLPIETKQILVSKLKTSNIITIIPVLICTLIFIVGFNVSYLNSLFLIIAAFVYPMMSALIGLLMNLKYPKLHCTSDTEAVKQSMSPMLAVYLGMAISVIPIILFFNLDVEYNVLVLIVLGISILVDLILYYALCKIGVKKFNELNY